MTGCKFRRIANRYVDGELSGRGRERFEKHLANCAECREFRDGVFAMKKVFGGAAPEALDPRAVLAIVSIATAPGGSRARELFWFAVGRMSRRLLPATAALSLLLLGALAVFSRSSAPGASGAAGNQVSTTGSDSYYSYYSMESREQSLLNGGDDAAKSSLYSYLAGKDDYGKSERGDDAGAQK